MSIFHRPDYQSDATQFINQLKATKPELDKQQQAGRALLWDKQVDRQLWNDTARRAWPKSLTSTRPTRTEPCRRQHLQ